MQSPATLPSPTALNHSQSLFISLFSSRTQRRRQSATRAISDAKPPALYIISIEVNPGCSQINTKNTRYSAPLPPITALGAGFKARHTYVVSKFRCQILFLNNLSLRGSEGRRRLQTLCVRLWPRIGALGGADERAGWALKCLWCNWWICVLRGFH